MVHLTHEAGEPDCCDQVPDGDCCEPRTHDGCCEAPAPNADCCDGTTDDSEGHPRHSKGSCCSSCKERALPPTVPSLDDQLPSWTIDFVATAVLAVHDGVTAESPAVLLRRLGSGPPPRPSGRDALAAHSVLVI
jgi:hypothetical protein